MYIEKHQRIALLIFVAVVSFVAFRDGNDHAINAGLGLLAFLLPILFYRMLAWLASFGLPEIFAKDYGSENHPGPYAFFFWILFVTACLFAIFKWSIY